MVVSFWSTRSQRASGGVRMDRAVMGRSGAATLPSNNVRRWPTILSIVPASKMSVLYSIAPSRPSGEQNHSQLELRPVRDASHRLEVFSHGCETKDEMRQFRICRCFHPRTVLHSPRRAVAFSGNLQKPTFCLKPIGDAPCVAAEAHVVGERDPRSFASDVIACLVGSPTDLISILGSIFLENVGARRDGPT